MKAEFLFSVLSVSTLSQNGRFSAKKSGQFRGSTKDALLHSHINRVTFSLTSTLPMANSGCLCPVIVAGWRAGRLGLVKRSPITCYGVVAHRQHHVFDGDVAGDRSRPPALAGGVANWQSP